MERDPMAMALSTDIVMDVVLRHLKVTDLLSCRLASKFWNKGASSVLRKRSTMMKTISEEKDLMELQTCMEQSSDFPFAGLRFDFPWSLNSSRAAVFFQNYGDRFTYLCLDTLWVTRMHDLAPFINSLSRLSILEVGWPCSRMNSASRQEDTRILQLPSVRTIRISSPYQDMDEDVFREVTAASSPSLQIECLDSTPESLTVLKSAGKLLALSVMTFYRDHTNAEFMLTMDQYLSTESPSLTKLDFYVGGCLSMKGLKSILFSSQHTLKELLMDGERLSECSWDKLPVFAKLTTLTCRVSIADFHWRLFQGSNGHNFPALKELKLDIAYKTKENILAVLLADSLVVPSVTMIELNGYINANGMKALAQSFPNVVEMRLKYGYYSGELVPCGRNPFEMWNVGKFKNLEKLRIWNYTIRWPSRKYIGMDSFLTGIPVGICKNLFEQNKQLDLINSPFNHVIRENPSILQLPDLKELVVCVTAGSGFQKLPEDMPFMSMVSVWYALEMMPNLRAKFVYENPSPSSRNAERDEAVLKAAFKHVQPFVTLEPFFY